MDFCSDYYGIALIGSIKELGRASIQIAKRFNQNNLPIERFSDKQYPSENAGFDIRLNNNAKASDFINLVGFSTSAILMKDYVYEFFSEYKLPPHKSYDSNVIEYNGVIHNYKWVHFILDDAENIIDFEKSTFAVYLDSLLRFHKYSDIQINSVEEYKLEREKDLSVQIENVKFTSDFRHHEYDLFILPPPIMLMHDIIIKKRLAISLQKTKFTSYRLKELPDWG